MIRRLLLCTLAASFLVSSATAQPRNTKSVPEPEETNPVHEAAKRDAEKAYASGDFTEVVQLMDKVVRENPRDHVALYLRGSARIELGIGQADSKSIRQGIADSRQSILYDKKDQSMYYLPYLYGMTNLTLIEGSKKHAAVAVQVADDTLKDSKTKGQDRANLLYQKAYAEQAMENYEGAAADYKAALAAVPAHLGAHVALAEVYVLAKKDKEALAAFDEAIKTFPDNALVYNNRGMFHQQKGDLEQSIQDFTKAIKFDRNYHYSYTNRGYSLMQQGKADAAEIDYNASLEKNPDQIDVISLRAACRLSQGKADAAAKDYQEILKKQPKNAVAWADLGFARFYAQDFSGAYDAFTTASKMDDELRYVDPWRYLALARDGKTAQADALFSLALRKIAVQRDWIDTLIAYQAGKVDMSGLLAAVSKDDEELKKAQECEAQFFAGQKLVVAGEPEKAQTHFKNALESGLTHLSAYRGSRYQLKDFSTTADAGTTSPK